MRGRYFVGSVSGHVINPTSFRTGPRVMIPCCYYVYDRANACRPVAQFPSGVFWATTEEKAEAACFAARVLARRLNAEERREAA